MSRSVGVSWEEESGRVNSDTPQKKETARATLSQKQPEKRKDGEAVTGSGGF